MLAADLLLVLAVVVFAAVLYWPSVDDDHADAYDDGDLAAEPVAPAAAD